MNIGVNVYMYVGTCAGEYLSLNYFFFCSRTHQEPNSVAGQQIAEMIGAIMEGFLISTPL